MSEDQEETAVPVVGSVALRDAHGRFGQGNLAAVLTGEHSEAFWREHEDARRELVAAIVSDAGSTLTDAPRTLLLAAEGCAQAALIRDSAYQRMVASGGPLTSSGRVRRAFTVWQAAIDRCEKHVRLLGIQGKPRQVPTLAEVMANAE
jgi:hypothetical protein